MAFTLQPAMKDDFFDREGILNEMISKLVHERTRMGFAPIGPMKVRKAWLKRKYIPTNL